MRKVKSLIREASELPAEDRAVIIDSLLRTLHPVDPAIDKAWLETAGKRLAELSSGNVKPVSGEEVFTRIVNHLLK